jgi:hemolysin activation/secretion protein
VPLWRTRYELELRQGVSVFDATRLPRTNAVAPTRADGDPHGTLLRGSLQTDVTVTSRVSLATVLRGQYAFDPLLAFEEFSAGAYTIGRGYDPGTLVGDDGVGMSGELRINRVAPFGPAIALQPFAFLDTARVWNKHGGGNDDLLSLGGGVRASFRSLFRLDLTVAVPMRAAGLQTRNQPARLLGSFTTKLWPWGDAQ